MTSGGFAVDDAALDTHARDVDEVAAAMCRVADAARPLALGSYGLVGQLFAHTAARAAEIGSAAVRDLSVAAHDLGDGVRACRDAYLDAEQRTATSFAEAR